MAESSSDSSEGGRSESLNVDDLFATDDTDISIDDGESTDDTDISIDDGESTDSTATPGTATTTPEPEDTTAGELFQQLRDEHDDADQAEAAPDVTAVTDESPADIMARADAETAHVDQIDDAIRADEGALDDLLLTGRREADGFLWVETDDDDGRAGELGSMFDGDDDGAEPAADEFSLPDDDGESFDERAATFDATEALDVDASAFGGGDDPDWTDEDSDASTGELDATSASSSTVESDGAAADADDGATDPDDDGDGLASRIRSILTG